MAVKTLHVYRSNGAWAVKKEGVVAKTFPTQREAIEAARQTVRGDAGQLVVYGKDGQIREHETYGMTPVQDPPKRSPLAKRIGRAVGKVALKRVTSDHVPPGADARKK